jgi:RNA polymerase sigma-70 factor (ECF subfamily)
VITGLNFFLDTERLFPLFDLPPEWTEEPAGEPA